MSREVMFVKFSPNNKFLGAALLDNTVKIFFADSLKFFLSLYGHKLPVLCFDFSFDSTLIVTASADKNVKIWGTDFGDCHKSIFAHDEAISWVQFVPKTHYFFTCSKDKRLKYFDADTFQHIQTLEGHSEGVWALAVSNGGHFVVSGAQDKSIRVWERTEEQLFLEEEKNRFLEQNFEKQDLRDPQQQGGESAPASKTTGETLKEGERLMEAIEFAWGEQVKLNQFEEEQRAAQHQAKKGKEKSAAEPVSVAAPQLSPLLMGYTPAGYVINALANIRPNNLDLVISQLPNSLVGCLTTFLQNPECLTERNELIARVSCSVIKIHGEKTNFSLDFSQKLRGHLSQIRHEIGYNLAALEFVKHLIEDDTNQDFFVDAELLKKQKVEKNKRKG